MMSQARRGLFFSSSGWADWDMEPEKRIKNVSVLRLAPLPVNLITEL